MTAAQQLGLPPLPQPGLHPGYPAEAYHQRVLGVVSKSALDLVRRSPEHYLAWVNHELDDRETAALTFGRAFHCALLEPERFAASYASEPDFGDCRFKENKVRRDAWRRENSGKEHLSELEFRSIAGMVASVKRHPLTSKMVRDGEPELTMTWKDPETGLLCKIRMDYYVRKHRMIVDFKSTDDASYDEFRKDVENYGYHRQDALYRAGAIEVGEPVQHFILVAVEKTRPYAPAIYSLDAEAVGKGYSSVRRDIVRLAECVKGKTFPGYPPGIQEMSIRPWVD